MGKHAAIIIYNSVFNSPVIFSTYCTFTRNEPRNGGFYDITCYSSFEDLVTWRHRLSFIISLFPEGTSRPSSLKVFAFLSQIFIWHSIPLMSTKRTPKVKYTTLSNSSFEIFPLISLTTLVT